ncbi:MAG: hypothetical protein ACI4NM_10175 [Bullifex sp.]
MDVFEDTWRKLMENGQHSEKCTLTLSDGSVVSLNGIFYSGTFETSSPAPYMTKTYEDRDMFQVAIASLGERTHRDFKGAKAYLPSRGTFIVADISGKDCGNITLLLKEVKHGR